MRLCTTISQRLRAVRSSRRTESFLPCDQKSGTNIETPIATMVDAFKQAMAESGGGATTVVIQLDGKEIARSTVKNINNMTRAAGKPVLLY